MSTDHHRRRTAIWRVTSDDDDDDTAPSVDPPPAKRPRLASDPPSEASSSRQPPPKAKRPAKRKFTAVSDSDEFDSADADPESDLDAPPTDDDEYMSEPKATGRKGAVKKTKPSGGKGKGKEIRDQPIMARDQRAKRPADNEATPALKRPKPKPTEQLIDVVGDSASSPAVREEIPIKKLPRIRKNKLPGSEPSTPSIAKPPAVGTDGKLPLPVVAARKQTVGPQSVDLDLSNPTMYAQLFKSGGLSTPSGGNTRRDREEERKKEYNKLRDEARAKRIADAVPPFDLQAPTEKIDRFEQKLKAIQSPSLFPNHLAGGLRRLQEDKKLAASKPLTPAGGTDPSPMREDGEV